MAANCICSVHNHSPFRRPLSSSPQSPPSTFLNTKKSTPKFKIPHFTTIQRTNFDKYKVYGILPMNIDPWAPTIDSQSIASQLFALSLFPYLGFLYFITMSKSAPKLTVFGFYFLLAFVGATIPAGIYAKVHYGTSLSNVDWLHGGAESLLTLSNLFVVLGLRKALREPKDLEDNQSDGVSGIKEDNPSS